MLCIRIKNMESQNLKTFITVAETQSFSVAADNLHISQSTVSKRIAQLEQQFNVRLFDRIARNVSLTEAGKELLPRARSITEAYANAIQAIDDLSGAVAGKLKLAISHHLGLHRLPKLLQLFTQQYPSVVLDIDFMDSEKAYEEVLSGGVELSVVTLAPQEHDNIRQQTLWHDRLFFVCGNDHPLATITAPTISDLANYPAILPGLNTYTGRIVRNLFKIENIAMPSPMTTNYLETIGTMVEVNLGWSVLPETLTNNLQIIHLDKTSINRQLGYIHHQKRTLSRAAKAFLALLERETNIFSPQLHTK